METVAVYWEEKIKTYGFNEIRGLAHIQAAIGLDRMADLGRAIEDMGGTQISMRFVLGHCSYDYGLCIGLLIEQQWEKEMVNHLREVLGEAYADTIESTAPVGLVFFHGPHFGDRYGIADSAFGTLTDKGIPIVAAGCSVNSVYLVLPETRLEDAKTSLAEAFALPSS